MRRNAIAVVLTPWADTRLRCGIGHEYAGRVQRVQRQGIDMDGEGFLYPPESDFDPAKCVVCGLVTWTEVDRKP